MTKAIELRGVARELRTLYDAGAIGSLADGHLLDRFIAERDEAAFEALVRRHGTMVWGVCRRVLADRHDAEDAFQATFLVLAVKAASVSPRDMLPNWLHGVARRTAMKARAVRARRHEREKQAAVMPNTESIVREASDDRLRWLDHELSHLPERYRTPIVLCELQGLTYQEAARRLNCPVGTLAARLSRGKVLLAKRLARRGVAVSAGGLTALIAEDAAAGSFSCALAKSIAQAAPQFVIGQTATAALISLSATILARTTIRSMLIARLKIVMGVLASFAVVGSATSLLALSPGPARPVNVLAKSGLRPSTIVDAARHGESVASPILTGRIEDEAGRPLAGTKVVLYKGIATRFRGQEATTDADGRYRFDPLRTGAVTVKDESTGRWDFYVGIQVAHPTHVSADGNSWWDIRVPNVDRREQIQNFKMVPGGWLRGRVVDTKTKQPVAGAHLRIHGPPGRRAKFHSYATTDGDGRFTSEPLFPGKYVVDVNSPELRMLVLGEVVIETGKTAVEEFSLDKLSWAIARAMEAHGGSARLEPLKAFTATTRETTDAGKTKMTVKHFIELPDRYRFEIEKDGDDEKSVLILTAGGNRGWSRRDGGAFRALDLQAGSPPIWPDDIKFFGPLAVLRIKDGAYRPSLLKDTAFNGRPAFGLSLIKPSRGPISELQMFFDRESGRLVRMDRIAENSESVFAGYQEFNAIPIARKMTLKTKGGAVISESDLIDFKAVDAFDSRLFERP